MRKILCDFCGAEVEPPVTQNTSTITFEWHSCEFGPENREFEACIKCFDKIYGYVDKKLLRIKR